MERKNILLYVGYSAAGLTALAPSPAAAASAAVDRYVYSCDARHYTINVKKKSIMVNTGRKENILRKSRLIASPVKAKQKKIFLLRLDSEAIGR